MENHSSILPLTAQFYSKSGASPKQMTTGEREGQANLSLACCSNYRVPTESPRSLEEIEIVLAGATYFRCPHLFAIYELPARRELYPNRLVQTYEIDLQPATHGGR